MTYPNMGLEGSLLWVVLVVVVWVHAQVVELEFLLYPLLEGSALLEGQAVALGNNRDDVDKLAQLLEHNDVDGLQGVARRLDEEQAAVDAGVLEVSLTLSSKLLAEVGAVLVLDVLDNGIPAALVVDQVAVSGCVDDVEAQTNAVLLNDVRDGVDGGGAAWLLVGLEAALAVHQVRREDGVDERRLAETSLACSWISWSAMTLHAGNVDCLPTQMTLNWKPRLTLFFSICLVMLSKPT